MGVNMWIRFGEATIRVRDASIKRYVNNIYKNNREPGGARGCVGILFIMVLGSVLKL